MSAIVGCTAKVHYILNGMGMSPSYDAVDQIRRRLCHKVMSSEKGTLADLQKNDEAVFAVDNLDQSNHHGLTITGKTVHGMHPTAIQAVMCNVQSTLHRPVRIREEDRQRHMKVVDARQFVDSLVTKEDDADINAYVAFFYRRSVQESTSSRYRR